MALEACVYLRNLKSMPFWMKGLIYKLTFNPRIFDIKSHYFCFLTVSVHLTNSVTLSSSRKYSFGVLNDNNSTYWPNEVFFEVIKNY